LSVQLLLDHDVLTDAGALACHTVVLVLYLLAENALLRLREPRLFWINPVLLASVLTFLLPYALGNVLFFMPEDRLVLAGLLPEITPAMNRLMLLVVLGACAMWTGYCSGIGDFLGRAWASSRLLGAVVRKTPDVRMSGIYACLAVGAASRLAAVRIGVYGYSATLERQIEMAAYSQYLYLAGMSGTLALIVLGMRYFGPEAADRRIRNWFWLTLVSEVGFGFLSGFKSAVCIPFVVVGLVGYIRRDRFPRWIVPALILAVVAAYAVIEPFRAARFADADFDETSMGSIVGTMLSARADEIVVDEENVSLLLSIAARTSLTHIASLGIAYREESELPPDSPDFLGDILRAPLTALVPRFVWSGKSLQSIGRWYYNEVMGVEGLTSVAMGPVTYLNFAGGAVAVVAGFFLVGIVQRGILLGALAHGVGGMIVFLGLLRVLAIVDSSFYLFPANLVRLLPMLVAVQWALLARATVPPAADPSGP
jgi:hypothetical protein